MSDILRAASGDQENDPEGYSRGEQEPSDSIPLNHREIVKSSHTEIPPTGGLILFLQLLRRIINNVCSKDSKVN